MAALNIESLAAELAKIQNLRAAHRFNNPCNLADELMPFLIQCGLKSAPTTDLEKMRIEWHELDMRLSDVEAEISKGNPEFMGVTRWEKLISQRASMRKYLKVLGSRIYDTQEYEINHKGPK